VNFYLYNVHNINHCQVSYTSTAKLHDTDSSDMTNKYIIIAASHLLIYSQLLAKFVEDYLDLLADDFRLNSFLLHRFWQITVFAFIHFYCI